MMGTKPTYDEVVAAYDNLVKEKERYRVALKFYARPIAYAGANQLNEGHDPFTPKDNPYIQDVVRDNGQVARRALSAA